MQEMTASICAWLCFSLCPSTHPATLSTLRSAIPHSHCSMTRRRAALAFIRPEVMRAVVADFLRSNEQALWLEVGADVMQARQLAFSLTGRRLFGGTFMHASGDWIADASGGRGPDVFVVIQKVPEAAARRQAVWQKRSEQLVKLKAACEAAKQPRSLVDLTDEPVAAQTAHHQGPHTAAAHDEQAAMDFAGRANFMQ